MRHRSLWFWRILARGLTEPSKSGPDGNEQTLSAARSGEEVFSVQTRARHPFADQLIIGLHEPVLSLVLIEQGTEFRDEAGLPFRHQDLDLAGFLVDLEILDQPKRLAPPLVLQQDPERQFDVRSHARPGLIQFSAERIRLRGLKFQKILQLSVKPHGMLTSWTILIPIQYDPWVPPVPCGFSTFLRPQNRFSQRQHA